MTGTVGARVAIGLAALATAAAAAAVFSGSPAGAAAPAAAANPRVYQAEKINQNIVLGPSSAPTTLTSTAKLPAGTYMITTIVGAVISAHDQIVCATSAVTGGNDGVFGTAGNPGTGGIYGTATMTDTIAVTAGQRISVSCNAFNFGLGTYATTAVVEAVPVAAVVKSS